MGFKGTALSKTFQLIKDLKLSVGADLNFLIRKVLPWAFEGIVESDGLPLLTALFGAFRIAYSPVIDSDQLGTVITDQSKLDCKHSF